MLFQRYGDIFQVQKGIIAHGCNARGYMGAGVAAIVRAKFPNAYGRYKQICDAYNPDNLLGKCIIVRVAAEVYVANMITQKNPGADARESAIKTSLLTTVEYAESQNMEVHSVKIGCGIGGLEWKNVLPLYEEVSEMYPLTSITVWEY